MVAPGSDCFYASVFKNKSFSSSSRITSSAKKSRGVAKELNTFLKWEKSDIIGYTVETLNSKDYVTKWCAKYKDEVIKHPNIKGAAIASVKAFVEGTENVTKFQVSKTYIQ